MKSEPSSWLWIREIRVSIRVLKQRFFLCFILVLTFLFFREMLITSRTIDHYDHDITSDLIKIRLRKINQSHDNRWQACVVIGYGEKGILKTKNGIAKSNTVCVEEIARLEKCIGRTIYSDSQWQANCSEHICRWRGKKCAIKLKELIKEMKTEFWEK